MALSDYAHHNEEQHATWWLEAAYEDRFDGGDF